MNTVEEILANCNLDETTGCLLWQFSVSPQGNAQVNFCGKTGHAHRFVFEHFVGPVPEGTKLRRFCPNAHCCNHEHWTYLPPSIEEIVGNCKPVWHDPHLEKPCLVWQGNTQKRYGHGQIYYNGRTQMVYKVAYELLVGPVPEGKELDHVCRNPPCLEPSHLEPVPHRENVLRGEGLAAQNARKTHCKRGHEFTPENTYLFPKGGRRCRTCKRLAEQDR